MGLEQWIGRQVDSDRVPSSVVPVAALPVEPILDLGCVDEVGQKPRTLRSSEGLASIKLRGRFCQSWRRNGAPEIQVVHLESGSNLPVFLNLKQRAFVTAPLHLAIGDNSFETSWIDSTGHHRRAMAQILENHDH
ncbi:MAG: hypothetical protein HYZ71_05120 [Deltaproteobacteria bacterium]|nr:hypothetical protein [Deltaproteobacteria bacterium]